MVVVVVVLVKGSVYVVEIMVVEIKAQWLVGEGEIDIVTQG